jgi:hypothetical protein
LGILVSDIIPISGDLRSWISLRWFGLSSIASPSGKVLVASSQIFRRNRLHLVEKIAKMKPHNRYRLGFRSIAIGFVAAFAFTSTIHAQGVGMITGTVTDPSAGAIPGATITLVDEGTTITNRTQTTTQGYYVFPALHPATYTLTVDATGFASAVRKGVVLQVDESVTVNITMALGQEIQNITVESAPSQVNTFTSTLSEVVDRRRIADLPLNGRNAASLALITAGVVQAPSEDADQGSSKTFPVAITISANGARQHQTNDRLDGADNNDIYTNVNLPFPFPDALQEFSVQTSNYSAKYGGNAGGVVNVVTKSGTNELHGNTFEFDRNAVFNARNFFAARRDQLKRNQFGATLGGPIVFPHLYDGRNKAFFFMGYQGTRIRNTGLGASAYVPTQAEVAGDFSAMLTANPSNPLGKATIVNDPVTNQPFPGNAIPVSRLDRAALALTKYLPQTTANGQVYYGVPTSQAYDEMLTRADYNVSNSDRLSVRYYFDRFYNAPFLTLTNYLSNASYTVIGSHNAMVSELHTFAPNVLNDLHISFCREQSNRGPAGASINVADLGVKMYQPPGDHILETINVSGFFGISQTDPATFTRNQYALGDSVSWVHGQHSFTFGIDVHRALVMIRNDFKEPGDFTFTAQSTNDAMASFMLGNLTTFNQGNGEFKDDRVNSFGLFVQDDFRATRKLTLNFGLRYDPEFPWKEVEGRVDQFSLKAYYAGQVSQVFPNAPAGLLFPGDAGVPKYGILGRFTNFGPRAGFAYDISGNGRTSIRGGVGMFYDALQDGYINNAFVDSTPFSTQVNLTYPAGPFSNPYLGITNPFPAPYPPPKNIAFPLPDFAVTYDPANGDRLQTPVAYNWNFTVERQLAAAWLLRIGYVGSHASHLLEDIQLSPAVYIPGSTLSATQRRLLPQYSTVGQASFDINSSYNSLQVTVEKKLVSNLTVLTNYTWSKSIDDLPYGSMIATLSTSTNFGASPIPWYMPGRHQFDRGPSEFNHTHRLVASFVWDLPRLKSAPGLVRHIVGGWQLTGLLAGQSGQPVQVLAGVDKSGTAIMEDRGVFLSDNVYGPGACGNRAPCVNYLNPAAFGLPTVGTYGNIGKYALHGPNLINYDGGLFKTIPIHNERVQLQFRAECFNVLNRTNFFTPGQSATGTVGPVPSSAQAATISSAGFGAITGSYDPRIGQLALKLMF